MPVTIDGFKSHYNNVGPRKGLAFYYREDTFMASVDINEDNMQISKFISPALEIITVYRSEQGNMTKLLELVERMILPNITTIVCGDFNFCYLANRGNKVIQMIENRGFQQVVNEPTHIKVRNLDQFYIKLNKNTFNISPAFRYTPYYADHDEVCVTVNKPDNKIQPQ